MRGLLVKKGKGENVKKETIFAVEVGPYLTFVTEDGYRVINAKDGRLVAWKRVPGLSGSLAKLGSPLKVVLAQNEDFDVIYLYQPKDRNFGYAINMMAADCSEWGYAPFPAGLAKAGSAKGGGG